MSTEGDQSWGDFLKWHPSPSSSMFMSYGPFLGILAHFEEEEMEQNFLSHLVTSSDV